MSSMVLSHKDCWFHQWDISKCNASEALKNGCTLDLTLSYGFPGTLWLPYEESKANFSRMRERIPVILAEASDV